MRRGEARRGEKRNEPRCGAERSGAERSGSACLDRDVATVWPSYALLPLLLSFSEPHFSLLHCLSVCLSHSVSLYTTTTVAAVATLRGSQKAMSRSLLCRCTTSREFVIYEERQAPGSRMNESFNQVFLPLSSPSLCRSPSPRPFRSLFIARLRHGPSL